jgi:hypothetical protein
MADQAVCPSCLQEERGPGSPPRSPPCPHHGQQHVVASHGQSSPEKPNCNARHGEWTEKRAGCSAVYFSQCGQCGLLLAVLQPHICWSHQNRWSDILNRTRGLYKNSLTLDFSSLFPSVPKSCGFQYPHYASSASVYQAEMEVLPTAAPGVNGKVAAWLQQTHQSDTCSQGKVLPWWS